MILISIYEIKIYINDDDELNLCLRLKKITVFNTIFTFTEKLPIK